MIDFIIEGVKCQFVAGSLKCPDPKLFKRLYTVMTLPSFYESQYFPGEEYREIFAAEKLVRLFKGKITKASKPKPAKFNPDVKY